MIERAVVHSAARSIHFGKRWVFSFVLNEAKYCKCRTLFYPRPEFRLSTQRKRVPCGTLDTQDCDTVHGPVALRYTTNNWPSTCFTLVQHAVTETQQKGHVENAPPPPPPPPPPPSSLRHRKRTNIPKFCHGQCQISSDHNHQDTVIDHNYQVTASDHNNQVTASDHNHQVTASDHNHQVTASDHNHQVTASDHNQHTL